MKVLVTGGAGYIGSHTCVRLIENGHEIAVLDNLSNSNEKALQRVKSITGADFKFYKADLLDKEALNSVFSNERYDAVIHFAGLKAVGESVEIPLKYYANNVSGTINLCEAMKNNNVKKLVFSSSATVYGNPKSLPITEDFPVGATNPYGQTKLMIEYILKDLYLSDNSWDIALLRYFNPIGAHPSGLIGEDPRGIPNNLLPYISQVAVGRLPYLNVYGNDYDTPDGSGVRDYIHVIDLADGHIKAIDKLNANPGLVTYNLGTGNGFSVFEMIRAYEKASKRKIEYKIMPRRQGDIAACYANTDKAKNELGFQTLYGIDDMCESSWKWQEMNPNGYK
ncbi:MAG: UDP-glucose 4-epimerase GalE [Firmicutes bacterium]|nr:UDP-glucose 4-epimerase GalE [Bacillota bacterium]